MPALLPTLIFIQTHLEEDLSLEALAQRSGFSAYHFHRIFREVIGEPLKAYIRRLRLEKGAYRLKISQDTILQIALDAGFKTHETFTRAFLQRFGLTPSAFRADFLRASSELKQRLQSGDLAAQYAQVNAGGAAAQPGDAGLLANRATGVKVRIEHTRPLTLAFVRHVGSYHTILDSDSPLAVLWETLFQWGNDRGLINADSLLIGIPQDDPSVTPPEKQRFDVCVQVPNCRDLVGEIGCQIIPAGVFGVGRHYGSFEHLADTYMHIYNTLVATGKYQLRLAVPFEVYTFTRVREDLRIEYTDVYLPVEPAKT